MAFAYCAVFSVHVYRLHASNVRKGNRSYNEMYGSNPNRVMAVFAYNTGTDNIDDPIKFVQKSNKRTDFLQKYALEHDIPFIVFGN